MYVCVQTICCCAQESFLGAKDAPEKTIRECTPESLTTWTGSWIIPATSVSAGPKVPEPFSLYFVSPHRIIVSLVYHITYMHILILFHNESHLNRIFTIFFLLIRVHKTLSTYPCILYIIYVICCYDRPPITITLILNSMYNYVLSLVKAVHAYSINLKTTR